MKELMLTYWEIKIWIHFFQCSYDSVCLCDRQLEKKRNTRNANIDDHTINTGKYEENEEVEDETVNAKIDGEERFLMPETGFNIIHQYHNFNSICWMK